MAYGKFSEFAQNIALGIKCALPWMRKDPEVMKKLAFQLEDDILCNIEKLNEQGLNFDGEKLGDSSSARLAAATGAKSLEGNYVFPDGSNSPEEFQKGELYRKMMVTRAMERLAKGGPAWNIIPRGVKGAAAIAGCWLRLTGRNSEKDSEELNEALRRLNPCLRDIPVPRDYWQKTHFWSGVMYRRNPKDIAWFILCSDPDLGTERKAQTDQFKQDFSEGALELLNAAAVKNGGTESESIFFMMSPGSLDDALRELGAQGISGKIEAVAKLGAAKGRSGKQKGAFPQWLKEWLNNAALESGLADEAAVAIGKITAKTKGMKSR